jgi:hypothetical protein
MAETIDFLRRLSSMMAGGRNAEMLLVAADMIDTLSRRATTAERLYQEQQDDHAKNLELREIAELAADNLIAEVASLKAQLDESGQRAEVEIASLKMQLAEAGAQAETDRAAFAMEALRLRGMAEDAEARLAEANATVEALRHPVATINEAPDDSLDDSLAVVPVQSLRLARTQFGYLADGFARSGDLVSQTICEIGACAIENALADHAAGERLTLAKLTAGPGPRRGEENDDEFAQI